MSEFECPKCNDVLTQSKLFSELFYCMRCGYKHVEPSKKRRSKK